MKKRTRVRGHLRRGRKSGLAKPVRPHERLIRQYDRRIIAASEGGEEPMIGVIFSARRDLRKKKLKEGEFEKIMKKAEEYTPEDWLTPVFD